MADFHIYTLTSCNPSEYPSIPRVANYRTLSTFDFSTLGALVYINDPRRFGTTVSAQTYTLDYLCNGCSGISTRMMTLGVSNLTSCADTNKDKFYRVVACGKDLPDRYVFFSAAQTIGNVVVFASETNAWIVTELISYYDETLTVAATYANCNDADIALSAALTISANDERTIGYAVKVTPIKTEPVDRGFSECCYSALVVGDLSDDDKYKNDFSSVFYQKQTPADTVTFQIIKVGGATTNLVDVTHGVLYDFDVLHHNPNLSYFKVEWRKILNLLGAGQYTIRMNIVVGGLPSVAVDSNTFQLKPFSIDTCNGTVAFDGAMDGKLVEIETDFKNSEFETRLRLSGYFGNQSPNLEQENLIYSSSSRTGLTYYEGQVTMKNDPSYTYQAENLPECISRQLIDFLIFSNDIYISDYNKNNHSYRYNLSPVVIDDISDPIYPVESRGVTFEATFKGRSKNKIKTNC
jgi:hypothetical protein